MDLVLVDGRNVQRSGWPQPDAGAVLAALDRWADTGDRDACEVVAVFDGFLDDVPDPQVVRLVEVRYADDELVELAAAAVAEGRSVRAATSDRELIGRLEAAGAVVAWGGGRLHRELGFGSRHQRGSGPL